MEKVYNLADKTYVSFENEVEQLFLDKIKFITEVMDFKDTYDSVLEYLDDSDKNEIQVETLYSGAKALRFNGSNDYECVLLGVCENISDKYINRLNIDKPVYGLKIIDRICHKNLHIYFDEEQKNILFSFSLDEQYILIKNFKMVKCTSNDFSHILWLLSVIGDCMFEFTESD